VGLKSEVGDALIGTRKRSTGVHFDDLGFVAKLTLYETSDGRADFTSDFRQFESVALLIKVAGIGFKVLSAVCTLYVCWLAFGTFFLQRICDRPGSYSIVTNDSENDSKVKATVFTTDCGAMTATRTIIKFSNAVVSGRTFGDTVVVLTGVDCGSVHSTWATNREFVVTYPQTGGVEFAVAKTRGVSIKLDPK